MYRILGEHVRRRFGERLTRNAAATFVAYILLALDEVGAFHRRRERGAGEA